MTIYDPRQMKGICMEEFYSIPKSSRLSSFLVTDKHESVHFCVPDVLAVLFAVYMKGKGSSVCGVIGHGTLLFTFPLG